ncbi:hypothetical protein C8J57DRAFT_1706316 [Mycena rebaudengoi]|nr:hypothetical protein C8J57DRAFT_1706316 [Mycena rebaudengoi]
MASFSPQFPHFRDESASSGSSGSSYSHFHPLPPELEPQRSGLDYCQPLQSRASTRHGQRQLAGFDTLSLFSSDTEPLSPLLLQSEYQQPRRVSTENPQLRLIQQQHDEIVALRAENTAIKANFRDLLHTVKSLQVGSATPATAISPELDQNAYPHIRWWQRNAWTQEISKANATTTTDTESTLTNSKLSFVEDINGNPVTKDRASAIRKEIYAISEEYAKKNSPPSRWGQAPADLRNKMRHGLEEKFPEIRFCSNAWKVDAAATQVYPSYYASYATQKTKTEPLDDATLLKRKRPADDDQDIDDQAINGDTPADENTPTNNAEPKGKHTAKAARSPQKHKAKDGTTRSREERKEERKKKKRKLPNPLSSAVSTPSMDTPDASSSAPAASTAISSVPLAPTVSSSLCSPQISLPSDDSLLVLAQVATTASTYTIMPNPSISTLEAFAPPLDTRPPPDASTPSSVPSSSTAAPSTAVAVPIPALPSPAPVPTLLVPTLPISAPLATSALPPSTSAATDAKKIKARKFYKPTSSTTARNLCGMQWKRDHPGGFTDEFDTYWKSLSATQKQDWKGSETRAKSAMQQVRTGCLEGIC